MPETANLIEVPSAGPSLRRIFDIAAVNKAIDEAVAEMPAGTHALFLADGNVEDGKVSGKFGLVLRGDAWGGEWSFAGFVENPWAADRAISWQGRLAL